MALAGAALLLVGCRMDVAVDIDVNDDGSGTVSVGVGVDDDLLSRVPGAADRVRLGDLADAGWQVSGPDKEADGQTWVHIEKPFANPDELNEILDEINGPSGPVGDFELTITEAWDETTWQLTGTAGLTGGVATFVDAELAGAFGTARPLEDLVAESGVPIEEGLNLTVTVTMPNEETPVVVRVPLDGRTVPIEATSSQTDESVRVAAIVAGVCGALLAGWLAYWLTRAFLRVGRRRDAFTRG